MTTESVYAASPECRVRRCRIERRYDELHFRSIYQHGENPEAVIFIDHISVALDSASEARRQFREFAERCHRYDDGEGIA